MKRSRKTKPFVCIVGTGLIGASIGLALRRRGKQKIVGWDRNRANLAAAVSLRAVDRAASSLEDALSSAATVVLAVPLKSVVKLLPQVLERARRGALVIDVAGLKVPVMKAARGLNSRPDVMFVGGHPLAGSEKGGPEHASADLFAGRSFALCSSRRPQSRTTLQKASILVKKLGAIPVQMSAARHDRIIAMTSALPQLMASALALTVAAAGPAAARLSGPGFDSATRLVTSPPELWIDNLLANNSNVDAALAGFEKKLRTFQAVIKNKDRVGVQKLLRKAAQPKR